MKCTISDCNAPHRTFVRFPGQEKPKPFCGPHALEMKSRFSQTVPESENLAPVIDIKTRERIASWSERYSKKSSEKMVWFQLIKSFDEKDMNWIKDAKWTGPIEVSLDKINFSTENTWTAEKEPKLVKSKVKKIKKGKRKPVVLIDAPKDDKYFILDGHHRALAYKKLDMPIPAFIGKVDKEKGPWDTFHTKQKPKDPEAKV